MKKPYQDESYHVHEDSTGWYKYETDQSSGVQGGCEAPIWEKRAANKQKRRYNNAD